MIGILSESKLREFKGRCDYTSCEDIVSLRRVELFKAEVAKNVRLIPTEFRTFSSSIEWLIVKQMPQPEFLKMDNFRFHDHFPFVS